MALNNVRPVGDDQPWKREVESVISQIQAQITILQQQVQTLQARINK